MAGFGPIGSAPIAGITGGITGAAYTLSSTALTFTAATPSVSYLIAFPLRTSWIGAEVFSTGSPSTARLSWIAIEVFNTGAPAIRASSVEIEVLRSLTPVSYTFILPNSPQLTFTAFTPFLTYTFGPLRTSWMGAEVFNTGSPIARVSWVGIEVFSTGNAPIRASWMGVEVFRTTDASPVGGLDDGTISIIW